MKIRQGFVSNSSTTSFCIYGYEAANQEEKDLLEGLSYSDIEPLRVEYGSYRERYIGAEWRAIKDNETGAEFKARVQKKIEELLGHPVTCFTFEDAYYNG